MKFRTIILALLLSVLTGLGASVTLAWDPNPETNIAGYRIYWRIDGGTYSTNLFLAVTNGTTGTVSNLFLGITYKFVATAYNTSGLESDYSNEVTCTIPGRPAPPQNLRTNQVILQASLWRSEYVDGIWLSVYDYEPILLPKEGGQAFYKTKLSINLPEPP